MPKQKLTFTTFKELTRLEFSLFALPFILAGAIIPFARFEFMYHFKSLAFLRFLWIIPAFFAARLSGMAFNQLIDWQIDAKNTRTKDRALPAGRATTAQAGMIAWSCLFLFIVICACINQTCLYLGLCAAFLLVLYSYMKRIHMSCHFILGLIHFLGPVMAAAVIEGNINTFAILLGIMSGFSIAANDIIWAIQDYAFDVKEKLHSIPAKLGIQSSLWIARASHCIVLLAYHKLCLKGEFPRFCKLGLLIMGWIYFKLYKDLKKEKIPSLFFNCNISIPLVAFFFVIIGVIWGSA